MLLKVLTLLCTSRVYVYVLFPRVGRVCLCVRSALKGGAQVGRVRVVHGGACRMSVLLRGWRTCVAHVWAARDS